MSTPLVRLLRQLSAGFSNQDQAFDNPPLRPHPGEVQAPSPTGAWIPAAGAVVRLRAGPAVPDQGAAGRADRRRADHSQPGLRRWAAVLGAVDNAELRALIQPEDLQPLNGCSYVVREQGQGFVGEVEPGCGCLVHRKGATAYLVSSFELDERGMRTIDRGHDPESHEQLWGSQAGPFEFRRTADYSGDIPDHWVEALQQAEAS